MSRVHLITTGGTIASRAPQPGADVVAVVSGAELRAGLFDPLGGIDLVVDDFCTVSSFAFDLPLAFKLARRIGERLAQPGCDGVVVTHGTDTMEESCYMAALLCASDKPVVFTGAQRNAQAPDGDGPRNIAGAVRLAAARGARGLGAMIFFEGDFHAARDVTKTHTSRTDTFRSGEHGKLGEVDGERVVVQRRPAARPTFAVSSIRPDVELVRLAMGSSDRLLRCAAAGAGAIVLECFGRGNAPSGIAAAVADIVASGTPVIVTSRCAEGRVEPIYGDGGGKDMARAGAIFAGDLSGAKARVLASVLLGAGLSGERFKQAVEEIGN